MIARAIENIVAQEGEATIHMVAATTIKNVNIAVVNVIKRIKSCSEEDKIFFAF